MLETAVLICKVVDIRCYSDFGDSVLAMTLNGGVGSDRVLLMAVVDVVDVVGGVAAVDAAAADIASKLVE